MAANNVEDGASGAEESAAVPWAEIVSRLNVSDPGTEVLLRLFEQRYEIDSASVAFIKILPFLGQYMLQEFDYSHFCESLNIPDDEASRDSCRYAVFTQAAQLMLKLAITIAKAHDLDMSDWKEINEACGSAIQLLPLCYRLQRMLPGALNSARALRFLTDGIDENDESNDMKDLNPWKNSEAQHLFSQVHNTTWNQIEVFTNSDEFVVAAFSGEFEIIEVNVVERLAIVTLMLLYVVGENDRELKKGDMILWEVEEQIGQYLKPGVAINANWHELQNEMYFISALTSVSPLWAANS